jgi:hypothetical protein
MYNKPGASLNEENERSLAPNDAIILLSNAPNLHQVTHITQIAGTLAEN